MTSLASVYGIRNARLLGASRTNDKIDVLFVRYRLRLKSRDYQVNMVKRIPRAAVRAKAFLFTNAAIVGVAVAERKISQSCFAAPTIHAAAIAYVVALLRIVFLLSLVQCKLRLMLNRVLQDVVVEIGE